MVPVFETSKKVMPLFEREKRSCQYLIITLKVVPLYDVNPIFNVFSKTESLNTKFSIFQRRKRETLDRIWVDS